MITSAKRAKFRNEVNNKRYQLLAALMLTGFMGVAHAQLSYTTSWIGNSLPGGAGGHVPLRTENIFVTSTGLVMTNSIWDEAGAEAVVFQNGALITQFAGTHCCGGKAITANATTVYVATGAGNASGPNGVRAYNYNGIQNGNSTTINTSAYITGLAASSTRLYVSDPSTNSILVRDATTLAAMTSFAFSNPGRIVLDNSATLWIVDTGTNKIRHFSTAGAFLGQEITDVGKPTALAIDNTGRLMVGDSGSAQQVIFYNNLAGTPARNGTFGVSGGIYSGSAGTMADNKLISPTGVGMDSSGNIYVSSNIGGAQIRVYNSSGTKLWDVQGLEFMDSGVPDPATNGADVYTKRQHFTMDYSKRAGQEYTYSGMTINSVAYPTDPRISFFSNGDYSPIDTMSILAVRNVQGRKYMYITDAYSNFFGIYRLNGDIAIPAGVIVSKGQNTDWLGIGLPVGQAYMWTDTNGDGNIQANEISNVVTPDPGLWGWDVDQSGNIWAASEGAGIVEYALQSIDGNGTPHYAPRTTFPIPAIFNNIERIKYISSTDTMYLSGYTQTHPYINVPQDFGLAGTEIVRYDNWSTNHTNPHARIVLPYDPANSRYIKNWDVAGTMAFASIVRSYTGEDVHAYSTDTGVELGQPVPGPEVYQTMGWTDASHTTRAFQRNNGEYLVWVEDDAYAKVIMYRLQGTASAPPTESVTAPSAGATVSGTVTLSATASASAGMAGVQFKVDGVNAGAEVTAAPYSTAWNSAAFSNGQHSITATARDMSGNVSTSSPVTVTVQNSASQTAIRVNAGGPAYTDPQGNVWAADTGFSASNAYSTTAAVAGTNTPVLYQTQRWNSGTIQYQFSVPNGGYSVKLKFAELYFSASGQRVFNVAINGQAVLSNFDAIAQAGANTAVDKQFTVNVTGGQITIQFTPVAGEPIINAIEILPQAAATSVSVSPGTASLGASATQQFTATVTGPTNTAVTWSLNPAVGSISASGLYTAPGSISSTSTVKVTATSVADPTKSASASVTLTAGGSSAFTPIRINGGGPGYTDPSGKVWKADTGYDAGNAYGTGAAITGTTTPGLYQTTHWNTGGFTYTFAVPNGSYGVNLKFAEIYYTQPGQRAFNVTINGKPALSKFDIVAQAGAGNAAVDRLFTVATTSGQIVIQFTSVTGDPQVNGIEITAAPTTSIRVNAGGPAYTDPLGQAWSADTGFNAGNSYTSANTISGTPTSDLYQTVRWNSGALQYQTAVPNGNYAVTLKFAELYYTSAGQRVFNVSINGQTVLTNFDALALGGKPNAAIDKTFYVPVTGGQLVIQFTPVAGEPDVSAIQVVSQ
jgi:hypothetical protein